MSQLNEGPIKTFTAAVDIDQYARVKLDANGELVLAVATDDELGVTERPAVAGRDCPVRLRTSQGTTIFIASTAIAIGNTVYGAAAGKVNVTDTGSLKGTALSSTSAGDEYVEVLRS
ncbi:MAG: capsid cement protein [Planctomycetota bacterium]